MTRQIITLFTDGSSLGNPGPGGWGAICLLHKTNQAFELGGRSEQTTNNRMELTAAVSILAHITTEDSDITLFTDSSYVINGITSWVRSWEKNNWLTSAKQKVLNQDLWKELVTVVRHLEKRNKIVFHYVKGHAEIPGNERVDTIATSFAQEKSINLFSGSFREYEMFLNVSIADLSTPPFSVSPTKKSGMTKLRTSTDALAFAVSQNNLGGNFSKSPSSKKAFSYLSMIDAQIERHPDWESCKKRVHGKRAAKFRKTTSKEDEQSIIADWQNS